MRRLVFSTVALGLAAGLAAPALAAQNPPPVPVGVGGDGNNGICVYAFTWVPQCVDLGQIGGSTGATPSSTP
jgi:hypothetical protein